MQMPYLEMQGLSQQELSSKDCIVHQEKPEIMW